MTQAEHILSHLKSKGPISPLIALREYGCFRLGARIWDLRRDGWPIDRDMVSTETGKRVALYRIGPREKWPSRGLKNV
jgi:hypothetical protein